MKIDVIECTVKIMQNDDPGLLQIVKAGVGAIPVTEAAILMMRNSPDPHLAETNALGHVRLVGQIETNRGAELERLTRLYGKNDVNTAFPGGRAMPERVEDLLLPEGCLAKDALAWREAPEPEPEPVEEVTHERAELLARLKASKAEISDTDALSDEDIREILREVEAA